MRLFSIATSVIASSMATTALGCVCYVGKEGTEIASRSVATDTKHLERTEMCCNKSGGVYDKEKGDCRADSDSKQKGSFYKCCLPLFAICEEKS